MRRPLAVLVAAALGPVAARAQMSADKVMACLSAGQPLVDLDAPAAEGTPLVVIRGDPGSVVGDVTTQSLVIGDGAILEGHVSMKKTEGRVLPLRQEAKKESASSTS